MSEMPVDMPGTAHFRDALPLRIGGHFVGRILLTLHATKASRQRQSNPKKPYSQALEALDAEGAMRLHRAVEQEARGT